MNQASAYTTLSLTLSIFSKCVLMLDILAFAKCLEGSTIGSDLEVSYTEAGALLLLVNDGVDKVLERIT